MASATRDVEVRCGRWYRYEDVNRGVWYGQAMSTVQAMRKGTSGGLQPTRVGVRPSLAGGAGKGVAAAEHARLQEHVATLQGQLADLQYYKQRTEYLADQLEAAGRCQICKDVAHLAWQCPDRYNCQICGTRGHSALSCPKRYSGTRGRSRSRSTNRL